MFRLRRVMFLATMALCGCGEGKTPPEPSGPALLKSEPHFQKPAVEPILESEKAVDGLGEYVEFPAVGIKMRKPAQFEKSESFQGFGLQEKQSSVLAMSIPGPFSKVTEGFTQEKMATRGWTLHAKQNVQVQGKPALLIHFEQPAAGSVVLKWNLAFGDEKKTTLVTATFPKEHKPELSDLLRATVLSARTLQAGVSDSVSSLPFSVKGTGKLKNASSVTGALIFTKEGTIPTKGPAEPLFVVAPSLGQAVGAKRKEFSELRLMKTAQAKGISIQSTVPLAVDGLEGFETLARAKDAESGIPLLVYQVMLFDEGSYFLMQGLVGSGLGDEYLPEFKALAHGFKRKMKP